MKLPVPVIRATMKRRLLINYRVKPETLAALLPDPFRPKIVNGWGLAGICLIRLEQVRPRFAPGTLGIASENAAHRIAVEWDENSQTLEGVFIPRRDSNSHFNALAGGRLFPGVHHHSTFWTAESNNRFKVEMCSDDGEVFVRIAARVAEAMPHDSVLRNRENASAFFCNGACGWSPDITGKTMEGLKLQTDDWRMEPLIVEHARSSWFENRNHFPEGSVEFDSAFLMRNIDHEWHALPPMQTEIVGQASSLSPDGQKNTSRFNTFRTNRSVPATSEPQQTGRMPVLQERRSHEPHHP